MLSLKSCSRCGGDTYKSSDWYGEFISCLNCGHQTDISKPRLDVTGLDLSPGKGGRRKSKAA